MMLNINLEEMKKSGKKIFLFRVVRRISFNGRTLFSFSNLDLIRNKNIEVINDKNLTNTHLIGSVMYTEYFFVFQLSGCILIGCYGWGIVLTLRRREGVLRQDISKQVDRKEDSIELIKVKNDNAN